ncbi:MAG: hypothetical protein DCC67_15795, partial [Planctomycetota bacterium]
MFAPRSSFRLAGSLLGLLTCLVTTKTPLFAVSVEWTQQFGSADSDAGASVALDSLGNVYLAGHASDGLGGPGAGSGDAFVTKL